MEPTKRDFEKKKRFHWKRRTDRVDAEAAQSEDGIGSHGQQLPTGAEAQLAHRLRAIWRRDAGRRRLVATRRPLRRLLRRLPRYLVMVR